MWASSTSTPSVRVHDHRGQNVEVDNEDLGYGEWSVTDGFSSIRVNDLMYAASPAPVLNQTYLSITGALNYSFGEFKIEFCSSDDIVLAPDAPASRRAGTRHPRAAQGAR